MSSVANSEFVENSPKNEKYKTNSLLFMMNSAFEKNMKVDISAIASILQEVGFKLLTVKKTNNSEQDNKDDNELKITLSCGRSGMQAIYTKHDYVCNCQEDLNKQDITNEEMSGTKQPIINRLTRRPSNMAKELLSSIIAQKDRKNETKNEDDTTEEFQTPIGNNNSKNLNVTAENPSTWEVDPKTSPPSMTSSPLLEKKTETCSVCIEKEQKIADMMEEAKNQVIESIDKALKLLPKKNNTFTKKNFKRVSDILKLAETPTSTKLSSSQEIKTTVRRNTPKKSPRKIMLNTPVKNKTTPKLIKRNLMSPKRTLQKNYCNPVDRRFQFDRKSPMYRITPIDRISPMDRRSPLSRRSTIDGSPMERRNLLEKKPPQDKKIRSDTPIINSVQLISPQVKNTKTFKTSVPKLHYVSSTLNSNGSSSKPKSGIPSLGRFKY